MSTTTFQQQPSLFALNTQNVVGFNDPMLPASPSSTPPKRSSDCGSSSGLGMPKNEASSEEASSLTSESATAPELAFSPPVPSLPPNNGPTHAPFLSPIRFMRPPPPHLFYTVPNALAAGGVLPHSSPVPPPSTNTTASSTPNNLPQPNGLQAPSPPNAAVIPGIPPNGTPISATASAQSNDLFVHVEQGETISLAVGNEIQHIAGPATIRMVGHSNVNSPLPLHVPRGHSISQIVDEKGILRHLILSPQNGLNVVPMNSSGLGAPQLSHHLQQNLTPSKPATTSTTINSNTTLSTAVTTSGGNSPPKSVSPPNNMIPSYPPPVSTQASASVSNAETTQSQSFAQRKRVVTNSSKRNGNQTPNAAEPFNGTVQENSQQQQQLMIDQEERERLLEALNRIHQPTITRVSSSEADVHWEELDTSEAAAAGGPFPQIDPSEFLYEIFLYEHSPNGRLLTQKECPPLSNYNGVRLTRLKPNTSYHVSIRASLPERKLVGVQSQTAPFRTYGIVPDPPQYFRVLQRAATYLTFSWSCPSNCGSAPVIGYILQITKGKNSENYESVYEGPAENARINRLESASSYKARVAAQNEVGRSEFTSPIVVNTTVGMQHQPQTALPTTSASTSAAMNYFPVYPALNAGVHPSITHFGHIPTPSPMFAPKLVPPTLVSVSSRNVRLSWQPTIPDANITLEMSDSNRPYNFIPVSNDCYNATKSGATVTNLKSNREYRFRLSGVTTNGEIRSDYMTVKTHKDRYENSSYYQNYGSDKERLPAPILQKIYEDDSVIELSWKLQGYEYENITFVLEGSSSFAATSNYNDNNSNDSQWKVCYKGPDTAYTVRDVYLVAFRVQAHNKRNITSLWSDTCFARQVIPRSKRQNQNYNQASRNQYHNQTYSNQQYQTTSSQQQQQRQSTPPMSQKSDSSVQQNLETTESTPLPQIKAPACTVPKLNNITQSSIEISWKPTTEVELNANDNNKHSLIYELQRVDKQALIIYSGSETQFVLENLRPVEHVQVRSRAVILDYEGQRNEGDWSSIGSGITLAAITSPPQNLRLKSETSPFTLIWDQPAQLNGSNVIEYLINSSHFAMEENKPIESLSLQQLASTDQLEYSVESLLPAHIYIFNVVARNEAGKSAPSERFEFSSPPTPPSPPTQLQLEANSFESLYASWTAPTHSNGAIVEAYKLTLYHEKSIVIQETVSVDTLEYQFTDLDAEKQYTLEAQAKNNVGWSKVSRVSCTTLKSAPEPPQLSLVQATSNTLKLKWTMNGADSLDTLYFYLERENENGKLTLAYEGENHSAKIKSLRESSTHRFRIRASRVRASPHLAGEWSPLVAFQTTRQSPPGIRNAPIVTEIQPGLLQIEWQAYNKTARDSSEEGAPKSTYYKLQTAPKGNKGSDNWKVCYQGSSTSCTLNFANSTSSTLPTTRQYRVLVVQQYDDNEEVHSIPSPVAIFNSQRTPTDSPRKRSTKPGSGQSTPSSLGRSASNANASSRVNSTSNPVRGVVPSHKLSLYKRFKRFMTKWPLTERDGAFVILTMFVGLALALAIMLNTYYSSEV